MCSPLRSARLLALFALLILLVPPAAAQAAGAVIYVNAAAAISGDGSSWTKAFRHLQDALAAAQAGDEIWVAQGTYRPSLGADRAARFSIPQNVSLYGGFIYGMTARNQRDWRIHPTILSGDLLGNDGPNFANDDDNSYNVVSIEGNFTEVTTTLDGFTISGGSGSGNDASLTSRGGGIQIIQTTPTLRNLIISGNHSLTGGGIWGYNAAPVLELVTISGNHAATGGGLAFTNLGPAMTSVVISGNSADTEGGGIFGAIGTMTNVTISGNRAGTSGGALAQIAGLTITNSIIWGNMAPADPQFAVGAPAITHSIVQGGAPGEGNLAADPQFVAAVPAAPGPGGDLRLRPGSPAINAGSNSGIAAGSSDRDGRQRIIGGTVDMGAYEALPNVVSITRADPNPIIGATARFTVRFNMPVTNVSAAAFKLTTSGGQSRARMSGVTGSGATWQVTVSTGGSLAGSIRLDLVDTDTITAAPGVPLGGAGAGNGSFSGEAYTVGSAGTLWFVPLARG